MPLSTQLAITRASKKITKEKIQIFHFFHILGYSMKCEVIKPLQKIQLGKDHV